MSLTRRASASAQVVAEMPAMVLRTHDDREVDLAAQARSNAIVLFFFPGDRDGLRFPELAGCTPEACAFSEGVRGNALAGAAVYGVTSHEPGRLKRFVEREDLGVTLVSDPDGALADAFGVLRWVAPTGAEFFDRTTIIVMPGGRVGHVLRDLDPVNHYHEAERLVAAIDTPVPGDRGRHA